MGCLFIFIYEFWESSLYESRTMLFAILIYRDVCMCVCVCVWFMFYVPFSLKKKEKKINTSTAYKSALCYRYNSRQLIAVFGLICVCVCMPFMLRLTYDRLIWWCFVSTSHIFCISFMSRECAFNRWQCTKSEILFAGL